MSHRESIGDDDQFRPFGLVPQDSVASGRRFFRSRRHGLLVGWRRHGGYRMKPRRALGSPVLGRAMLTRNVTLDPLFSCAACLSGPGRLQSLAHSIDLGPVAPTHIRSNQRSRCVGPSVVNGERSLGGRLGCLEPDVARGDRRRAVALAHGTPPTLRTAEAGR